MAGELNPQVAREALILLGEDPDAPLEPERPPPLVEPVGDLVPAAKPTTGSPDPVVVEGDRKFRKRHSTRNPGATVNGAKLKPVQERGYVRAPTGHKRSKVISVMLTHIRDQDAAIALGVSNTTIYEWKQDPDFQKALQVAADRALESSIAAIKALSQKAIEVLAKELENPKPSVRINVADRLLSHVGKYVELQKQQEFDKLKAVVYAQLNLETKPPIGQPPLIIEAGATSPPSIDTSERLQRIQERPAEVHQGGVEGIPDSGHGASGAVAPVTP